MLNHCCVPWISGAWPSFGSGLPAARVGRLVGGRLPAPHVGELVLHVLALLDAAGRVHEEVGQVGGDRVLEAHVEVERHQHGHAHHHGPECLLEAAAALRQPARELAAADHQEIERDGGADPVRERGGEPARGEGLRRRQRDHAREDRPGARRVNGTETEADEQPRAEPVAALAGRARRDEPRQPRLEPVAQRGHGERDAEADQPHDRDVAQQVVRQPERVDHVDERDRDERERDRQPGDDPERPPPSPRRAGAERERQHRQHARRQRRADPGEEREQNQQDH